MRELEGLGEQLGLHLVPRRNAVVGAGPVGQQDIVRNGGGGGCRRRTAWVGGQRRSAAASAMAAAPPNSMIFNSNSSPKSKFGALLAAKR